MTTKNLLRNRWEFCESGVFYGFIPSVPPCAPQIEECRGWFDTPPVPPVQFDYSSNNTPR